MYLWGSQGLVVVKEMVLGEQQQLEMVGFHLLPPCTAAGEDWVVKLWVTYWCVPEMVELGENTPGLSRRWSTG